MITVSKAREIIAGYIRRPSDERIDASSCYRRVLAEDIISRSDIPAFDNSAMDGFALSAADTAGITSQGPKDFVVIGGLPAGLKANKKIGKYQALRIMTGAPIPPGASCVLRKEEAQGFMRGGRDYIKVYRKVSRGENIRRAGEDVSRGRVVLSRGKILGPAECGMVAALGRDKLRVYRRPRVGILATGDELIRPGQRLSGAKIYDSNSYSLYAAVLHSLAVPVRLGVVCDLRRRLQRRIQSSLQQGLDVLLISGGVSVGDYDYVRDALKALGAKIGFWGVKMRPGKPLAFAVSGKTKIFGLPGNPVSALVCFEVFVRPALARMSGQADWRQREISVLSAQSIEKKRGLRYFLRAQLRPRNGRLLARLSGAQGSGILSSLLGADGLLVLPEGITRVEKGDEARVMTLWH
ncbi:MAG: gephyrin-like molybdotransferase Glp [Candidatus Omnitrophota bacterium]